MVQAAVSDLIELKFATKTGAIATLMVRELISVNGRPYGDQNLLAVVADALQEMDARVQRLELAMQHTERAISGS